MDSISFGNATSSIQVSANHGTINFTSARFENSEYRKRDDEILKSLAFPEMLDRKDNIERWHPETCQWILDLEEYKSWMIRSHGLLWVKGKPGAGKSTLMAFLYDHLGELHEHEVIQLDFFFNARGTELQRTPLGMFRSLLNQIFHLDPSIRHEVQSAFEQRTRQLGRGENDWDWLRVVLEGLLTNAVLASASRQSVRTFVDALDEAGAESAQQLATYFSRLVSRAEKKRVNIQICISCRHYPIVGSLRALEICVEHHNKQDIASYVNDMLGDVEDEEWDNLGLYERPREDLVDKLTQEANGIFQWAYLITPMVQQRILEGESLKGISRWLREIPASLEDVYIYILKTVIDERNKRQAFLLFQWICFAKERLTLTEIRYALAAENASLLFPPTAWEGIEGFIESDQRMKPRLKALSGGLVESVPVHHELLGRKDTVQVIHQSVNDFLRARGLMMLHRHTSSTESSTSAINKEEISLMSHATLYRSCLLFMVRENLPRERACWPTRVYRDEYFIKRHLLAYSARNLFYHAKKCAYFRRDNTLQIEIEILKYVIDNWADICRALRWDLYPNRGLVPRGTKLLHIAAANDLIDILAWLLSSGEDVEQRDEEGNTALHSAVQSGNLAVARKLRQMGADIEAEDENGESPLLKAARFGEFKLVKWLLDEGADVKKTRVQGESALQLASLKGSLAVVQILMAAGSDINTQGGFYGNALQAASCAGHIEIAEILVNAGADVNAHCGDYFSALHAASYEGHTEVVRLLLKAHADVNFKGGSFCTALQAAAVGKFERVDLVQVLLDAQADVNVQGGVYGTALEGARIEGHTEIARMLLDAGAHDFEH